MRVHSLIDPTSPPAQAAFKKQFGFANVRRDSFRADERMFRLFLGSALALAASSLVPLNDRGAVTINQPAYLPGEP